MSAALHTCARCGAHLSLDHLRGTDCPYCRSAFPHHARAVEHAALVNQVMAQNIAAYGVSAPIVPVVSPAVWVAQANAMKRATDAVALSIGITVAIGVVLTIVLSVAFR